MNRGRNAAYNTAANLIAEIVAVASGFILPRLILGSFGSSYNGLIQSVAQFLEIVVLLRAGVGGVTRASLYRTLASKDEKQLSATIRATELFMRKVALIFAAFVVVFACVYPLVVSYDFEWFFSASLVLIISISTFVQYYFGITYYILLQADQRQYISSIMIACTTVVNTLLTILLIRLGCGIHAVKLGTAAAYCITPVALHIYAKRHYHIDKTVKPDYSSINQRWQALFHQLAGYIYSNTDIVLITFFMNLKEVSVYTTYRLVSNGLQKLMTTFESGVEAAFGDMIARDDKEVLTGNVRVFETLLHAAVCIVFGSALILITPFVEVYTKGVNDVNYSRALFGCLLIMTETVHFLRQPYHSIIEAAGHYKQTKHIAIIQAAMNLGLSVILINFFGLAGVIAGTLVSDAYCGIAYRAYVRKHLLQEIRITEYVRRIAVTMLTMLLIYGFSALYPASGVNSYLTWIVYAIAVAAAAGVITVLTDLIFYRREMKILLLKVRTILSGIVSRKRAGGT